MRVSCVQVFAGIVVELPVELDKGAPPAFCHCKVMLQLTLVVVYIHADADHSCPVAAGALLLYTPEFAPVAVSLSTLFVAAVSPMGPFMELGVSEGISLTLLAVAATVEDPPVTVVVFADQAGPVAAGTVVSVPGVESICESLMWFMVYSGNACTLWGGSIVVFVDCTLDQVDVWEGVALRVRMANV